MTGELLAREGTLFALETMRIAGLVIASPLLFVYAPARVRAGVVFVLALVAHASPMRARPPLDRLVLAVPSELMLGACMGFVVRLSFAALELANESISTALGLGAASLFDPHTQAQESALAKILRLGMMLVSLLLGVHRVLIAALVESFRLVPAGSVVDVGVEVEGFARMLTDVMITGMRLAFPVLTVLLIMQFALALVARAAQQLQIFTIGFAVMLLGGMAAVVAALPDYTLGVIEEMSRVGPRLERVVSVLVGR